MPAVTKCNRRQIALARALRCRLAFAQKLVQLDAAGFATSLDLRSELDDLGIREDLFAIRFVVIAQRGLDVADGASLELREGFDLGANDRRADLALALPLARCEQGRDFFQRGDLLRPGGDVGAAILQEFAVAVERDVLVQGLMHACNGERFLADDGLLLGVRFLFDDLEVDRHRLDVELRAESEGIVTSCHLRFPLKLMD